MKIGIMDSGIGGLTVLKECLKQMPNHEYFYYADSLNAPYGTKSKEEVYDLTKNAVDFLIEKGSEIIVLACNTATGAAVNTLRQIYKIPIIGMEPAIKPAIELANGKKVLVTATELTLKQDKFLDLLQTIDSKNIVDNVGLSELVILAESGEFNKELIKEVIKNKLAHRNLNEYGSVVLGCTHFPLYKDEFMSIFPQSTHIVDGTIGTTNRIKNFITSESTKSILKLYRSGEELTSGAHYELIMNILN